jgi:hypothetical protein
MRNMRNEKRNPFIGPTALITANVRLRETMLAVLRRTRSLLGLQIYHTLDVYVYAASLAMFLGRGRNLGIVALRMVRRHTIVPSHTS